MSTGCLAVVALVLTAMLVLGAESPTQTGDPIGSVEMLPDACSA